MKKLLMLLIVLSVMLTGCGKTEEGVAEEPKQPETEAVIDQETPEKEEQKAPGVTV